MTDRDNEWARRAVRAMWVRAMRRAAEVLDWLVDLDELQGPGRAPWE